MIAHLQAHFGFERLPFGRDLAPAALHTYPAQQEATARIAWTITSRSLGVLTGEVGCGKTMAVRAAIASLDPARHTIIYLPNPDLGRLGIYTQITTALGAVPRHHKYTLVPQTMDLLAAEDNERGRLPVLVADEAHLLANQQLEDLRLLTNFEMDSKSVLAVLLVGQPTLRRRIKLGMFAALDQRICMRYHLPGMNEEQTGTYIRHHLKLAGRPDTLFSDDATTLIHQNSCGLPRAINNLAIAALTAAYANRSAIVDEKAARAAITELTDE